MLYFDTRVLEIAVADEIDKFLPQIEYEEVQQFFAQRGIPLEQFDAQRVKEIVRHVAAADTTEHFKDRMFIAAQEIISVALFVPYAKCVSTTRPPPDRKEMLANLRKTRHVRERPKKGMARHYYTRSRTSPSV